MSGVQNIIVSKEENGQRLDRWLGKKGVPFFLVHKFCRSGQLRIDGKRAKADVRLVEGQNVRVPPYTPKDSTPHKGPVKLSEKDRAYIKSLVIYDDGQIIALNKPSGLATQGGTNMKQHVDRLLVGLADKDGIKPHLVHRLDKDTSGILLLARNAEMARALGRSFKAKDVEKTYIGITMGVPELMQGEIKAPLHKTETGRDKDRVVVSDEGKYAHTMFSVLETMRKQAALVAFQPMTGRTHQIRVHSAYMGCPLIGYFKYVYDQELFANIYLKKRLHLHAYRLRLPHPANRKKILDLQAPIPDDFVANMKELGFDHSIKADNIQFEI
ncbi:MAG: RluA family pseudouridine synthase [Pseudomonadota bacterium]|nr:RluA family pseudouridine synthase [Pseudomonadota bacterium]